MRAVIFVAAILISTSTQAAQFSIVSGTLHAQASVTGVPPTTDTPADVILSAAQPQGSVLAHASGAGPLPPVGSFSTSGGVSLNSASFSFSAHATGDGGVVGSGVGEGAGSFSAFFMLDAATPVRFQGSQSTVNPDFNAGASLRKDGNIVSTLPFNVAGTMDFMLNLDPGTYELRATGSINGGLFTGNGSENITATIVPEPLAVSIVAGAAPCVRRRRFRPAA